MKSLTSSNNCHIVCNDIRILFRTCKFTSLGVAERKNIGATTVTVRPAVGSVPY